MLKKHWLMIAMALALAIGTKASDQRLSPLPGLTTDRINEILSFLKPGELWALSVVSHAWYRSVKIYTYDNNIDISRISNLDMLRFLSEQMNGFFGHENDILTIDKFKAHLEAHFIRMFPSVDETIDRHIDRIIVLSSNVYFLEHADQLGLENKKNRLKICALAAKYGDLFFLQRAHEFGFGWDSGTCDEAAMRGDLPMLQYVHENGCPWTAHTCLLASDAIDCLKYAHENGCEWNAETCSKAAMNGNIECLKYAHENGCEWNADTCWKAAMNGNIDCLTYAHEKGCPWG